MQRIISINNTKIDLGNIKCIQNECPVSGGGGYLIVKLLRGKEYVYNEQIEGYELLESKIELYASSYSKASLWEGEIEQEWTKYLNKTEKTPNKT